MSVKRLRQIMSLLLMVAVLAGASALYFNHLTGSPRQRMVQGNTVIQSLEKVAKLATIVYKTEKVFGMDDSKRVFDIEIPGMQKKYMLLAKATVTAGIDLTEMKPDAIQVSGREVTVQLPDPVVLSREITDVKSYDQQLGLFRRLVDPFDVPTEVQRINGELLDSMVEDVKQDGLLDHAKTGAQAAIMEYLKGLGFEQVHFMDPSVAAAR